MQVGFVQAQPVEATVPGQCPKCGATAGFHLELTQTRAMLLVLPLVGFSSPKAGRCLACGAPPPPEVWRAMPRPSAVWRFGWLFFFLLPAVVFGGGYAVYDHLHRASMRAAREKQDAEQKQHKDDLAAIQSASNDCRDAYKKADQAEDACSKGVNEVMHAATKDVDKERERAPASVLGRAPLAVIGRPVTPDSPLLGDDTCPRVVPRNKLGYVVDSACSRSDASPDEIRAEGNKMAAAAAKLKTPDRFAIVSFECGAKTCSTTATWFDTPTKTILAVARATKPKTNDEKADKKALADALTKKIAAWK